MKIGHFIQKVAGGSMILAAMACPVFTSCYDDSALNERIDKVEQDIEEIKGALAVLENAAQSGLSIADYKPIEGGYELVFSDGEKINIYNGADGAKGDQGEKDQLAKAGGLAAVLFANEVDVLSKSVVEEEGIDTTGDEGQEPQLKPAAICFQLLHSVEIVLGCVHESYSFMI